MKSSTKDQAKGKYHEVKGKVKEVAGEMIDDPKLEAQGASEKIAGNAQKKVAESPCAPGCGCMLGLRRALRSLA
jgi:uncharacterized protein YjbJ (UPF0337 family)